MTDRPRPHTTPGRRAPGPSRAGVTTTWREAPPAARALIGGMFVSRLGGFVQVFIVLYLTGLGFSATQVSLTLAAYGTGSVVGVLAGGRLCDHIGGHATIVGSMVVCSALLPAVPYTSNFTVLLLVLALQAAAGQAYRPAAADLLSRMLPADRHVMIFAMYRLAINLGAAAAPLLGAVLIAQSYELLFFTEAAVGLVYAAVVARCVPRQGRREPAARARPGPRARGYRPLLADRRYLLLLFAMLISTLVYVQYLSALPLAVHDQGLSTTVYAVLITVNGLTVVAFELPVTRFTQRCRVRPVAAVGTALTCLGMTLYGPSWGIAGLVVATLMWSFGEAVSAPTLFLAYPARAGPPDLRGRYLGAASAMYGLGATAGPVLAVAGWNLLGRSLWWWSAVAGLMAVPAAWAGVRPGAHGDGSRPAVGP
ncbi:MFS transporter [Streptomyces sp. MST-110588]|uniref:MFS transporter n=1 Tax=Streptomyces sp. MST-110588 TaxID=2833628 RepID=UPI001F5DE8AA|nr:MFS transporter [Streptomyces sp. MST-110588]UNO43143.1 MFS transporter [Streptomyces sp. MST-110588]